MRILKLMPWLLLALLVSCRSIPDGVYIGLEEMSDLSPYDKSEKWYHENTFKVNGTDVVLEKNPVIMKNGETIFSASDGGFYYYSGRISGNGRRSRVILDLYHEDYGAVRYIKNPEIEFDEDGPVGMSLREKVEKGFYIKDPEQGHEEYEFQVMRDGSIIMDGVRYEPSNKKDKAPLNQ